MHSKVLLKKPSKGFNLSIPTLFSLQYVFIYRFVLTHEISMSNDEVKLKKERDPIMKVCFIVFLLTSVVVAGSSIYSNYVVGDDTVVINGDTVNVRYVGTYYDFYGGENAVVFDTNIWNVTNGNSSKSNSFVAKTQDNHKEFTVNVGSGGALEMFESSLINHKVGDKVKVMIPVGSGYTSAEIHKSFTTSSVHAVGMIETLSESKFVEIYEEFKDRTLSGMMAFDSVYGWPAVAVYDAGNKVVNISYSPTVGGTYDMQVMNDEFGKVTATVTAINNNIISYTMTVKDFHVLSAEGPIKQIQMIGLNLGGNPFFIISVVDSNNDGVAESFTIKQEEERNNVALYFEIEIISINP